MDIHAYSLNKYVLNTYYITRDISGNKSDENPYPDGTYSIVCMQVLVASLSIYTISKNI